MKKKRIILFLAMILALAIAGCNDKKENDVEVSGDVVENETVTENKNATEETQKTDNKKDNTTTNTETNKNNTTTNKNESTSNKNETTTKPSTGTNNTGSNNSESTTKPSTGSTNNNSGSTNNSGNTGNTSNNNGGTTTQPSTPVHEHKWTEVTEDEIHYYAWRTICGKCKTDLTDMTDDELTWHTAAECHSGYSTHYIEVDFVTENIVKTPVVTGYKCECGETKNK